MQPWELYDPEENRLRERPALRQFVSPSIEAVRHTGEPNLPPLLLSRPLALKISPLETRSLTVWYRTSLRGSFPTLSETTMHSLLVLAATLATIVCAAPSISSTGNGFSCPIDQVVHCCTSVQPFNLTIGTGCQAAFGGVGFATCAQGESPLCCDGVRFALSPSLPISCHVALPRIEPDMPRSKLSPASRPAASRPPTPGFRRPPPAPRSPACPRPSSRAPALCQRRAATRWWRPGRPRERAPLRRRAPAASPLRGRPSRPGARTASWRCAASRRWWRARWLWRTFRVYYRGGSRGRGDEDAQRMYGCKNLWIE